MAETQNTGQFAKTIVTDVGKDMIAKSQNGQTLTFSRVALGDGLVGEEEDVTKFTAVKNERLSLPIAKYSNLGNGQFQIQFRLTNSQVESGFWHREIGIMAKIDNGQEQLYAYTTAGNKASFIYDKTTPVEERIVNVNFVIGNAQNLEVIINSSVIYATIEDLEEALDAHDADADAHEPAFDAHNAADDAHKDFTGATAKTAGKRGMVPAPAAGDQNKALFGNATYKQVVQKVNGVAADSGGNVNVDMSGYLPLTGGTLTGALSIQKKDDYGQINLKTTNNRERRLDITDTYLRLTVMTDKDKGVGGRYLVINANNSLANAFYVQEQISEDWSTYYLFGQHNIASQAQAEAGTNNTSPVTPLRVAQAINALALPKGTILPFAGRTIPSGFLACNGAAVSRTTYSNLFSAIGTTYGSGDGSTTFNLPNLEDNRFMEFSSTRGTKNNAGLPNITGGPLSTGIGGTANRDDQWVGALATRIVDVPNHAQSGGSNPYYGLTQTSIDASKSSSIYGGSTTVQPKSLTVRAIIKY